MPYAQAISSLPTATPGTLGSLSSTLPSGTAKNIGNMAKDFEALFLSLLVKEMRQTLPEGLFPKDGGDVQGGIFDMYLGQHLADAGGVGLAETLTRQMDADAANNARLGLTRGAVPDSPGT